MLRVMGFVFGSAVALVALMVFTDLPALAPHRQSVEEGMSLLLDRLKAAPGHRVAAEARPPPALKSTPRPQHRALAAPPVDPVQALARTGPPAATPAEPAPPRQVLPPPQPRWHVLWNPFRSEFSANGFAERLSQATGMDFRVTRAGPGRYEVAFAYLDEEQRQSRLAEISAATGLAVEEQTP